MTKISAALTYLRQYPVFATPALVGLPIAVGFLVAGSLSSHPVQGRSVAVHSTGGVPLVVGGPVVGPTSAADAGASSTAGQRSGGGNVAQIQLARAAAAANPSIRPSGATRSGGSSGSTNVTAGLSQGGGLGLSLGHSGDSHSSSSATTGMNLSGLQLPAGFSVHAISRVQPVTGRSTPQPVQDWVATPSDTTTSSDTGTSSTLTDTLAAAGYNMSGLFSPANQPQLVPDFASYVDAGLSPSYAYGADSVSTSEVAVFQQLGFTLMKDVTTNVQFWVGPELALNPEFTPVTS